MLVVLVVNVNDLSVPSAFKCRSRISSRLILPILFAF